MNLAPSVPEQYALYTEMFAYSAAALVLFVVGIVLNWRVTKNLDMKLKPREGPQTAGVRITERILSQLAAWQGVMRRVRRGMTMMLVVGLLALAFANSTIITISGTELRSDDVAGQWQRWAGYTFYMIMSTAAMAQYYGIKTMATWLFALIPAAGGMVMGVFITLTSLENPAGADKVINFSVWGVILLVSLIPMHLIYTRYSIFKNFRRSGPILLHVGFALSLWAILWTGPEVGGANTVARRTVSAWLYFVMVSFWTLSNVVIFYTWQLGPPKKITHATDSTVVSGPGTTGGPGSSSSGAGGKGPHTVVNLVPSSPHALGTKEGRKLGQRPGSVTEFVRSHLPSTATAAGRQQYQHLANII